MEEEVLPGGSAAKAITIPDTTATSGEETEVLTAEIAPSGVFITMTGPAWTVRWAAPEILRGDVPGLASDVWALGWICWETNTFAIVGITRGDLPPIDNDDQFKQMKGLCDLMKGCWKLNATDRPTALRCKQAVDQIVPSGREATMPRSSGLLLILGLVQLQNDMYNEAREYFEQALEVARSVDDEWSAARALNAIGDVTYLRSEYSKAEESYIQAETSTLELTISSVLLNRSRAWET
ncbi:Tyrosine-protein kinase abl2, partial [Tulasnella sp. UAMH 9824]